jgi:hypothetical protein
MIFRGVLRLAARKLLARVPRQKRVNLADGSVEHGHFEPAALHVEHEVFTHDGQANEAKIAIWHGHSIA